MRDIKKLKIKCQTCKTEHIINIDTNLIPDTKKVKLLACISCSDDFRKNKFIEQAKRCMKPKNVIIDGQQITIECNSPKLRKYVETIPSPI